LTRKTGGRGKRTVLAFDAKVKCRDATAKNWHAVPMSERMWATAIDGDVALMTTGDGKFERETARRPASAGR
jgi:hypothetical protein